MDPTLPCGLCGASGIASGVSSNGGVCPTSPTPLRSKELRGARASLGAGGLGEKTESGIIGGVTGVVDTGVSGISGPAIGVGVEGAMGGKGNDPRSSLGIDLVSQKRDGVSRQSREEVVVGGFFDF